MPHEDWPPPSQIVFGVMALRERIQQHIAVSSLWVVTARPACSAYLTPGPPDLMKFSPYLPQYFPEL